MCDVIEGCLIEAESLRPRPEAELSALSSSRLEHVGVLSEALDELLIERGRAHK